MKYEFNLGLGNTSLFLKLICFCNLRIIFLVGSVNRQENLNVEKASAFLKQTGVKLSNPFNLWYLCCTSLSKETFSLT